MSYRTSNRIQAQRKDAVTRLQEHQSTCGIESDLYWAQIDTLCQTTHGMERSTRGEILAQNWRKQMGGVMPEALPDYYNAWMHAFYLEEAPVSLNLLFTQAGSLMAKLEWAACTGKGPHVKKMLALCKEKLAQIPEFNYMTPRQQRLYQRDLQDVLERYVAPDGFCRGTVRGFLRRRSDWYQQELEGLLAKLKTAQPADTGEHRSRRAQTEAAQPKEVPPVVIPPEEVPPVAQAVEERALPVTQVVEEKIPPVTQIADEEVPPITQDADNEALLLWPPESSWDPIEAEPEMVGLCAFLEKTSSAVYQRSLAHLYSLYRSPCDQNTGKLAQMALRDFFAALRALHVEPVDEQRFRTEFSEEYGKALRSGNCGKDYVMTACGWSCNDILVISPVFQKLR